MKLRWIIGLFFSSLVLRLYVVLSIFHLTLFPLQKYDSYIYVLKALEIIKGNWLPIHTHAIGLPIFLAPILYAWGAHSIFENFLISIIAVNVVASAIIFPLAAITYELTASVQAVVAAIAAFSLSFPLIIPDNLFVLTEPLFTLLFVAAIAHIYRMRKHVAFAYSASLLGGLCYWVRPNGIVVLPILLLSYWNLRNASMQKKIAESVLMAGIFFTVAGPMLYMRHNAFGSAFDYGENGKYFMERYVDVWGAVAPVTLTHYIATHGINDIFSRFFITGLCLALLYFAYMLIPSAFFFLYGAAHTLRSPPWRPIWISISIWIAALAPVFHLYYLTRHLFPIAPLGIIVGIAGLEALIGVQPVSRKAIWGAFIAAHVVILCVSISVFLFSSRRFTKDVARIAADDMHWAAWAATHIKGTIAAGAGPNIMMFLPDTHIGGVGMLDLYAPQSGIRITYPGQFDSLEKSMPTMKARGVTHVVLDDQVRDPMPFVSDKYLSIYTGTEIPPYFKLIYSNYETNSQSKVRIFWIDWKEYARLQSM